jgi:hypothetical protein
MLGIGNIGNGEAAFDISFNTRGGLNFIGFYGFAEFASAKASNALGNMTDKYTAILQRERSFGSDKSTLNRLKQFEPNKAAEIVSPIPANMTVGIMGTIGIQYDFTNRSFHAQAELFVNTPGGFLTGSGQRGRAGWGVFHINPNEWYMHLGSPGDRLGVRLGVGNLNVQFGTYLMAGSRIPDMPPPPRQVADILGKDLSSLTMGRDIAGLSTGRGFAFGADLSVATGDLTFLILYANFMAGLGFDFMLKDYGDMICEQTGRRVGLDGWYGMGQAYAYLQGELGVRVNLRVLRTRVPIIKGGAAALLQAGLPNPSFFRGHLGVRFNVLGGLVKGNMNFKISLGDECIPVLPGGSPLEMPMIGDIAPVDRDRDINVFTTPQVTFTTAVGEQFEATDDSGSTQRYRIRLRSFTLRTDNGSLIDGTLHWNKDRNALSFQSKEILPPNTTITARAEVGFERFSGGAWTTVITAGKEAVESKESVFITGDAPNHIPLENVVYSYPVIGQQYFLTDESNKGFVQLQMGQKYLFERGFDYKLMFTADNRQTVTADFRYNEGANRIEYNIPQFANRRQYTLQLVYTPHETATAAGGSAQTQQLLSDAGNESLTVENRAATAEISATLEESILEYGFASSRFTTFGEKIGSINTVGNGVAQNVGVSFRFLYNVQADEAFDAAEIAGTVHSNRQPLIRPYATLEEPFFAETVHQLVYSGYPFGNGRIRLTHRQDAVIGVPPVRSVFVYHPYLDLIADGARAPRQFRFPFAFEASIIAEQDFRNLQHLVGNNFNNVSAEVRERFLNNRLPIIKYGRYRVVMEYVLPDGTVTSENEFSFNNFLLFNK